jgi:hypothetical protein
MGELSDSSPFLVRPDSDEYTVLSFLVRNSGERFTPAEIATHTSIGEARTSETMAGLCERELVRCSQKSYYVTPDDAPELRRRLKSIDAGVRLHDGTPDDDAYSVEDWEE